LRKQTGYEPVPFECVPWKRTVVKRFGPGRVNLKQAKIL